MHMVSGPRLGGTGSCYDNAAAESFNTLLQEGGSEPEDLPNTETRHKGHDSLDRVTLQSETTPLGARVPHTQPRTPRGLFTAFLKCVLTRGFTGRHAVCE